MSLDGVRMKLIATSLLKLTQLGKARYKKPQSQWDVKRDR